MAEPNGIRSFENEERRLIRRTGAALRLSLSVRSAPAFRGEPHDDFNDASGIERRGLSAESVDVGLAYI